MLLFSWLACVCLVAGDPTEPDINDDDVEDAFLDDAVEEDEDEDVATTDAVGSTDAVASTDAVVASTDGVDVVDKAKKHNMFPFAYPVALLSKILPRP